MRSLLSLTAALFAGQISSAAMAYMPSPLVHAPAQSEPYLTRLAESADFASLYAQLKNADGVTFDNFPLSSTRVATLDLRRFDVLKPGGKVLDGSTGQELARPDVVLLRGTANGDPNSSVFLSLSRYGHQGWVSVGGEQYILSSGPANGNKVPVIYRAGDIPEGVMTLEGLSCGGALAPVPGQLPGIPKSFGPAGPTPQGTCRTVEIAVETDFEYTNVIAGFGGDPAASAAYITTLFGGINEIYMREFSTQVVVSYMRVFSTDTDPYPPMTNVPNRLDEFQAEWNAHQAGVDRNLSHMLTAARVGGVGGIAYLSVVCNTEYGYGVSGYINGFFPYPLENNNRQNWDIVVTSHEIGHNFNAPHTHNTEPPIDLCAYGDCTQAEHGTIMSYCHTCPAGPGSLGGMLNIALDMHPRIINEFVLPFLDYLATEQICSLGGDGPMITQNPADTEAPVGGTAMFGVGVTGAPTLRFQWYHDGAIMLGATQQTLIIDPVALTSAGGYDVVVMNDCGEAHSGVGILTVSGMCYDDFNRDGVVDFFDYLDFVAAFSVESPSADVNADAIVDFFDYLDFVAQFSEGC